MSNINLTSIDQIKINKILKKNHKEFEFEFVEITREIIKQPNF